MAYNTEAVNFSYNVIYNTVTVIMFNCQGLKIYKLTLLLQVQ